MKLSAPQITALAFLSKAPWVAPWWGGKPHSNWPKELNGRTVHKLVTLKFVRVMHQSRFDRAVTITETGKAALQSCIDPTTEFNVRYKTGSLTDDTL